MVTDPSSADASEEEGIPAWGWSLLLVGLVVLLYGRVAGFDVFRAWDDSLFAFDRPEIQAWWTASWRDRLLTPDIGYPIPLPTVVYATIHALLPAGGVVPAMHLTLLAFHVVNVLLVHRLARCWLTSTTTAGLTAILWASHPLLVESIAWVTNLKTVMFGCGALLAIIAWERHISRSGRGWWGWAGIAAVVFALGCRPDAVVLPVFLAVRTALDPDADLRSRRHLAPLAASALPALLYVPVSMFGHRQLVAQQGTAPILVDGYQFGERVSRICAALGLQARNFVWPVELHPGYDPEDPAYATWVLWGVGAALIWGGMTVWAAIRCRRVLWASLAALVIYAPASGIEYLPRFTADTYAYLPAALLLIAVAALVERGLERVGSGRRLAAAAAVVLAVFWSGMTAVQVGLWRSPETLFTYVISQTPQAPKPYLNLGQHYMRQEEYAKARAVFEQSADRLFETGLMPMARFVALQRTGAPQRALDEGLRLYSEAYEGVVPEQLHGFLTWITLRYDLEPPEQVERRRRFRRIARRAIDEFGASWPGEILESGVSQLARRRETGLAARLLCEAMAQAPDDCRLWELADDWSLRGEGPELPAPPGDCGEGQSNSSSN